MFEIVALTIILAIIAGILISAALKPNTFRIQRSATIKTTPTKLFALINDLSQWQNWSPWEKLDPKVKRSPSGPASGLGAIYAWDGNSKVGTGRMEIIESKSPSKVVMKLDFFKPFKAHNTAEFTLLKQGTVTEITWAMYGPQSYMSKVMAMLIDTEKMVGKQFEEGLANLKGIVEK